MISRLLENVFDMLIKEYNNSKSMVNNKSLSDKKTEFAVLLKKSVCEMQFEYNKNIIGFSIEAKKLVNSNFEDEKKFLSNFNKTVRTPFMNTNYEAFIKNSRRCLTWLTKLWEKYELNNIEWLLQKKESEINNFLFDCLKYEFRIYIKNNYPKDNINLTNTSLGHEKLDMMYEQWKHLSANLTPDNFNAKENEIPNIRDIISNKGEEIQNRSTRTKGLNTLHSWLPQKISDCLKRISLFDPQSCYLNDNIQKPYSTSSNNNENNKESKNDENDENDENVPNKQSGHQIEDNNPVLKLK